MSQPTSEPTEPRQEPHEELHEERHVDAGEEQTAQRSADRRSFFAKHPFLIYTALRIVVLAVVAGVLYLLGARGLILILLAFLLSAVASYILLASMRDEVGARMGGFFGRLNERIEESKRSEDDDIEYEAVQVKEEQRTLATEAGADPVADSNADDQSSADARNNSAG